MNNQRKFRVWDKMRLQFIYPENDNQQHFIIDLNGRSYNLQNGSGDNDYVVQEYTGLIDKYDNPIYEGDIIQLEGSSYKYEVVWNKWQWGIDSKGVVTDFIQGFTSAVENRAIVIGNIFENPELLKQYE